MYITDTQPGSISYESEKKYQLPQTIKSNSTMPF